MEIIIKDKKLKKIIDNEDTKNAIRLYGKLRAEKIYQRYNELVNIENFHLLLSKKVGMCHSLSGNYKGCYGLNLDHPYRMIIKPKFTKDEKELISVTIVSIEEIVDYH
ncbi:MAG: plasmid maintenance system killer protein [Candidatus Delongbacteria bacterium]|nr:plasmid maintenance system killer protein [Candidatus Delongbacteria bacterium]